MQRDAAAQFYAPATDYHDSVQRVFAVEAARVLAARENAAGSSNVLREVRWSVTSNTNSTQWDVAWLNDNGKTARVARISYDANALLQGPDFYRAVFKQLWKVGWHSTFPVKSEAAMAKFWKGAADAKPSREESLIAALPLATLAANPKNSEDSAQLAGLLAHTALPSIIGRLSIDSVLLARSAAWVALLEVAAEEKLPRAWVPVLLQAGRESAATKLWQDHPPGAKAENKSVAGLWDLWLNRPSTRDVFVRAAESPHEGMMMALLCYQTQVAGAGTLLAEMLEPLFGEDGLSGLHNYAPFMAVNTGVGGGHIMDGEWPYLQRIAWIKLLSKIPETDEVASVSKLRPTLSTLLASEPKSDENMDSCLIGLKEAVPLLRAGRADGVGPLAPTAAVSTRDLLNYGWEATGLQMGTRYRFVNRMWGVTEQAQPILRNVTASVEGLYPFFQTQGQARIFSFPESLLRLQLVDGFFDLVGWSPSPFIPKSGAVEGAQMLARRGWLRSKEFEWHVRSLWDGGFLPDVTRYMESMRDEGGALAAVEVLQYLTSINSNERTNVPKADVLMPQLAQKIPETTRIHLSAVWDSKYTNKNPFEVAQALERLYWQDVSSGFENEIINNYVKAGAYKSARRFFMQTREYVLDPVQVSNTRGQIAFVLGYLENDPELRRAAMLASRSGSSSDMYLHIWEAAIRDDIPQLTKNIQQLVSRYQSSAGPDSSGRKMLKFLPLLPALKDPNHASREEALRYFSNEAGWTVLRWIWIQKFKLPNEDAITFLGGRETEAFRHILVCSLEGKRKEAEVALQSYLESTSRFNEQTLLAGYVTDKMRNKPFNKPEPDLKPAEVVSVREAVLARLKEKQR